MCDEADSKGADNDDTITDLYILSITWLSSLISLSTMWLIH